MNTEVSDFGNKGDAPVLLYIFFGIMLVFVISAYSRSPNSDTTHANTTNACTHKCANNKGLTNE